MPACLVVDTTRGLPPRVRLVVGQQRANSGRLRPSQDQVGDRDVAGCQAAVPEQDSLFRKLTPDRVSGYDVAQLGVQRVAGQEALVHVTAQCPELSRSGLAPIVDDDLV